MVIFSKYCDSDKMVNSRFWIAKLSNSPHRDAIVSLFNSDSLHSDESASKLKIFQFFQLHCHQSPDQTNRQGRGYRYLAPYKNLYCTQQWFYFAFFGLNLQNYRKVGQVLFSLQKILKNSIPPLLWAWVWCLRVPASRSILVKPQPSLLHLTQANHRRFFLCPLM